MAGRAALWRVARSGGRLWSTCGRGRRRGRQRGDIILKADGEEVNSVSDLRAKVSAHKVGDTITLTIDRNDHERTVDVTLDEMPQDKKR